MLFISIGGFGISILMGIGVGGFLLIRERETSNNRSKAAEEEKLRALAWQKIAEDPNFKVVTTEEVVPEESEYDKNRKLFEKTGKVKYLALMEKAMEKDIPKEDDE
jgi:hypothetical protein